MHDRRGSWVHDADGSGFGLENLPYGACRAGQRAFLGVRIGSSVLDLRAVAAEGLLAGLDDATRDALAATDLGPLLALGRSAWTATRRRVTELLAVGSPEAEDVASALVPVADVELDLPFPVADFVDFYSSLDHAENIGRMFRPDAEPLPANWRHLPVAYHGRAGTVVVTGSTVHRPAGQRRRPDGTIAFGPTEKLDIELEVGFVVGGASRLGVPLTTGSVREHVFGVVLVNDWSARDIQAWEYVPLGPFLGKSFATSVSGWVVPLDALDPFRVPGPEQDPPVLPYLRRQEPWGLDLQLRAELRPAGSVEAHVVCDVPFAGTYWTVDQQLAHLTANGATVRPGDLFASGTVSGPRPGQRGSLIEATWDGSSPLDLGGTTRRFLEDGDEVVLTGHATREGAGGEGRPAVSLGEVRGTVAAGLDDGPPEQRDWRS